MKTVLTTLPSASVRSNSYVPGSNTVAVVPEDPEANCVVEPDGPDDSLQVPAASASPGSGTTLVPITGCSKSAS